MGSNVFECHIFQTIKDIRNQNRIPNINAIVKNIIRTNATNITAEDVKQQVDLLIAAARLKNMPTSQGLDSFYIIENSTTLQADLTLEFQQEDSISNIVTQITEQVSSQTSSPHETNRNQQIKDRFDNFNAQIAAIKASFMNEIYELKNEVERLKQKVKDQDNDMSDKAKLSLLEYENLFLKEELRNKQLIVEKLLDLKTDKISVQKPSENSNIHKVTVTHRSNETNEKKFKKKSPKAPIREYTNIHNTVNKKRVTVIGDSMVKLVKSENLSDENYIANIRANPGCTTEDIADYIKPIIRGKPDITLVHTGTNDLINDLIHLNRKGTTLYTKNIYKSFSSRFD